jgi:hypothetical protein
MGPILHGAFSLPAARQCDLCGQYASQTESNWAAEEFGGAHLGDRRRTRRLVAVAAGVLARPAGRVTEVFDDAADREGAFRLLENEDASADAIAEAAAAASVRRAAGQAFVFAPVDGTSLQITDEQGDKRLGLVGPRRMKSSGLQVMSAIAVAPDGAPIGMLAQRYWARTKRSTVRNPKKDTRPTAEKETRFWMQTMEAARAAFRQGASATRPWFQLDRGGDAGAVLLDGCLSDDSWMTVRAEYDRRLASKPREYLWQRVESQPPCGAYSLDVVGSNQHAARTAHMVLRYARVEIGVLIPGVGKAPVPLWAVLAIEEGTAPDAEQPLEWMLLTTYPVCSALDAELVVRGYATRWRIEQFHRMWKSGACRVEETQLRDIDHIIRWATILASVGMRLLRLTYLARSTPEVPATVELSAAEVEATILLRKPKGVRRTTTPTLADAVRWIADLGGYTGKSSGGPPGALVIARGLQRVRPVATIISDGEM